MATAASDIIDRASRIILDETNVRWPLPELCEWINDAQREIVLQKPNALSVNAAVSLTAGTYQAVPSAYLGLLRVVRNLKALPASQSAARIGARAVRVVSREVLDSQMPDWHDPSITLPSALVKHYLFDEQDQMHFYVYPPNDGTGVLECIFSGAPTAVAATGDVNTLASYEGTIALPDTYANAILDYVLYRAYSKDADFAGNASRATFHYQQFANSIGAKFKLDVELSPNVNAQTKAS